jgi:DNA polymerase I-like protein with 3'-5' exonuclease and polymerase domains
MSNRHTAWLKRQHIGGFQQPLLQPDSTWTPPAELPDLRNAGRVVVDVENRDDGLAAGRGSGWPFAGGHLCGVAVAWPGGKLYAPINHPDGDCIDPERVKNWLQDHFSSPGLRIGFHHCQHDIGWLRAEWGLKAPALIDDSEAMAVMVDENRLSYSLDELCKWRSIPGKDETQLREAAAAFGVDPKSGMWRLPAKHVGPYAEQDAAATLALIENLEPVIEAEGTRKAYELEMDLAPMVHEMRWRGIRVDAEAAERNAKLLESKRDAIFAELTSRLGERVGMDEIGRTSWLAKTFDKEKIAYPRTAPTKNFPQGQPSFKSGMLGWMDQYVHWLPPLIAKADRYNNAATKFLRGFIIDYAHKGRLHPTINQYRGEEGGTRTHRFSYSDPAVQQMIGRDKEITPLVRGCFIPEDDQTWLKCDASQHEYRLIVHFASLLNLHKAKEAVAMYHDNTEMDFHNLVAEWTGLSREDAKGVNFAKAYRAGKDKFANMIHRDFSDAEEIYDKYDAELPFVAALGERAQRLAERRGYLRLIDGARLHFDRWEPAQRQDADYGRSLEEARKRWPGVRLRRAFCFKAGNALIQGSAARHVKLWMRACWRDGIVPLLQLHDELDISVNSPAVGERMAELMRDVLELEVPIKVGLQYGRSWGDAKHSWNEVKQRELV